MWVDNQTIRPVSAAVSGHISIYRSCYQPHNSRERMRNNLSLRLEEPCQGNSTSSAHHAGLLPTSGESQSLVPQVARGQVGHQPQSQFPPRPPSLPQTRGTFHADARHGEAGRRSALPLRPLTYPERPSCSWRSLAAPAPAARTAAARLARTPPLFPGPLSARSNRSAPRAALRARDRSASPSAPTAPP